MNQKHRKIRDLLIVALIYAICYGIGYAASFYLENLILRLFVFDIAATLVAFLFSVALHNSSVYDPYWSFTPIVFAVWIFVREKAFSPWHLLFLAAFILWGLRLTVNWITIFTDFSYEDWRYRKFRDENNKTMWFFINLTGIHLVPTLCVFAGILPIFEIAKTELNVLCLPGILVILFGICLEFFADRQMHIFLHGNEKMDVCTVGLWNYSRHPNYLGEISIWVGVFLTMIPFAPEKWYYAIGMVCMIILFNVVSVPMMEKRQLSRRPAYADYRKSTSKLLLWLKKR